MSKAIIIAGTSSGCGKTALTLGLMQALTRRGLTVQGFKAGPDFIDPGLHRLATGLPSHNLDGWMLSAETVQRIFRRNHEGCDLSIIEGVMGLFDGLGAISEQGSTAQLSKILNIPVLLVVPARGMARSAAALVKGYADFDPDLDLHSVVFNMVGSPLHGQILTQALNILPEVKVLGALPRLSGLSLPQRQMGLVTAEDLDQREERLEQLGQWVEEALDLDALLDQLPEISCPVLSDGGAILPDLRIGYARDKAFCFYYEENLRLLRQGGAELVPFSPLEDTNLPPALHGLYLGGGYPDIHVQALAANTTMLTKIREFCQSGKPVYAEGGGFVYLTNSLTDLEGQTHVLAQVFDFETTLHSRRQALGYREIKTTIPSPLGPAETTARGHEFHYFTLSGQDLQALDIYQVKDRCEKTLPGGGYLKDKILGSLAHIHFASQPDLVSNFLGACKA